MSGLLVSWAATVFTSDRVRRGIDGLVPMPQYTPPRCTVPPFRRYTGFMPAIDPALLSPRRFAVLNATISSVAVGFIFWLIYVHENVRRAGGPDDSARAQCHFQRLGRGAHGGRPVGHQDRKTAGAHPALMMSAQSARRSSSSSTISTITTVRATRTSPGQDGFGPSISSFLISHIALSTVILAADPDLGLLGRDRSSTAAPPPRAVDLGWLDVRIRDRSVDLSAASRDRLDLKLNQELNEELSKREAGNRMDRDDTSGTTEATIARWRCTAALPDWMGDVRTRASSDSRSRSIGPEVLEARRHRLQGERGGPAGPRRVHAGRRSTSRFRKPLRSS